MKMNDPGSQKSEGPSRRRACMVTSFPVSKAQGNVIFCV